MIQSNELRLGNIFHSPEDNEIVFIEKIQKEFVDVRNIGDGEFHYSYLCQIQHLKPIELTPEILEKCGFEKSLIDESNPGDGCYYSMKIIDDKHCDLSFISGDKNGILEVCLFPYETWFIFQYIHQLQNLYYALTGKELDISKFIYQQQNALKNGI